MNATEMLPPAAPLSLSPRPLARRYASAHDCVLRERPEQPVFCLRRHAARAAASWFTRSFSGRVLYAVKTNPLPEVLDAIWEGGVRHFDVASLEEIALIRQRFPQAGLAYVHPVKSLSAIAEAYHRHGVRTFALDTREELVKLRAATGLADDLELLVRMATPRMGAGLHLSSKFGASSEEAASLLSEARAVGARVGLTFHVGSQTMDPRAWTLALSSAAAVIREAGVRVDIVDVGGGFPSVYPGQSPPPLQAFLNTIHEGFERMQLPPETELWCEPGRALAAEACSLLVRVEQRRGSALYLNDGTYGSLFDAGRLGFVYPVRLLRPSGEVRAGALRPFSLFGPTCDSLDSMPGPFLIPDDVATGDWLELGTLGAYSIALRTSFHGLQLGGVVEVADAPMVTLYPDEVAAGRDPAAALRAEARSA